MEFKGTKGKWEISLNDIKANEQIIVTAYGFFVKGKYTHTEETKANSLLISKAPEMLEMLKRIMKTYDKGTQTYLDCQKLIKEATQI
jgi:hypothetical protein